MRSASVPGSTCVLVPVITCLPTVGIGLLLAFTGLRSMGILTFSGETLSTLGGCPEHSRNFLYAFPTRLNATDIAALNVSTLPNPATVYGCLNDEVCVGEGMGGGRVGGRWGLMVQAPPPPTLPPPLTVYPPALLPAPPGGGMHTRIDAVGHHVAGHRRHVPHGAAALPGGPGCAHHGPHVSSDRERVGLGPSWHPPCLRWRPSQPCTCWIGGLHDAGLVVLAYVHTSA